MGDPFQGPRVGSCLSLGNELSKKTYKLTLLYWEGAPGGEQQDEGAWEDCSATWLAVSSFMVMELVSRLSVARHSDSGSILARASLSHDGCQRGFWEVVRHVACPFDLSQTLPVGTC